MRKLSFSLDDEQIKEFDEAGLCCPDDLIDDVFMASLPLLEDALLEALGIDCSPPPPPLMNADAAALSSMSSPFERWDVPTKPRRQPAAARKRPWSHPSLSFGVPAGPAAHGVSAVNAGEFGNDTKPGKFSYGGGGGNLSRLGHGGNAGEFGNDTKLSKCSYGRDGGGKLSRLDHVAGELGGGRKRPAGRQRDRPEGQRCGHCHTTETPQWRNGPDGPSTLCNACGIRFRMGSNKLVPEYRPSTSPFFRSGEHSNRHSKVQKLREKKVKALKLDGDGISGAPGRQTPAPM